MSDEQFNPAKCLRDWGDDKIALLASRLRTLDGPGRVTVQELRDQNAAHFIKYPTDPVIAKLWAINLEFTRRGIAPRWRGIKSFNPSAVPSSTLGLPANVPRLIGPAQKQKLLLRWADLQWLHNELGPSHLPLNLSWRKLFADHIDDDQREHLFSRVAASDDKPHRIVYGPSVIEPVSLTLRGFAVSAVGDRCRAVQRRVRDVIQVRLEALGTRPRYHPTTDALATRLVYAEAIELARGSPTEAARIVRWISGEVVTPQAAHQMRTKIASDIKLTGAAWK